MRQDSAFARFDLPANQRGTTEVHQTDNPKETLNKNLAKHKLCKPAETSRTEPRLPAGPSVPTRSLQTSGMCTRESSTASHTVPADLRRAREFWVRFAFVFRVR